MLIRWYGENTEIETSTRVPRAIKVGIPEGVPSTIVDLDEGFAHGQAVPEADRDVHIKPLAHTIREAIPAATVEENHSNSKK